MDERDINLIREALRLFVWGAGEGLSPPAGEPAEEPETTLFEYAVEAGDEDYDGYPDKIVTLLCQQIAEAKAIEAEAYERAAEWHEKNARYCREIAVDEPRINAEGRQKAKAAAAHHDASAVGIRAFAGKEG